MQLYRFSPITTKEELLEAIKHIHTSCYFLCKQSFGEYLQNSGNIGVFCHYDDEYDFLISLRKEMTKPSDNSDQKYFELIEPIIIPAHEDIPETLYTHLYIRKPDPYRSQTGDVDFILDADVYVALKHELQEGKVVKGLRVFTRPDLDMLELYDPDVDALGYVSVKHMTQTVRTKQSELTKL